MRFPTHGPSYRIYDRCGDWVLEGRFAPHTRSGVCRFYVRGWNANEPSYAWSVVASVPRSAVQHLRYQDVEHRLFERAHGEAVRHIDEGEIEPGGVYKVTLERAGAGMR
jgi:hypothetical protein